MPAKKVFPGGIPELMAMIDGSGMYRQGYVYAVLAAQNYEGAQRVLYPGATDSRLKSTSLDTMEKDFAAALNAKRELYVALTYDY